MGSDLRRVLYAGVVFWSALLLLLVQPIITKAILPWFGGSAGVWTTSMLFFQALLLLGYAYAHFLNRRLDARQQVLLHSALLLVSLAVLPLQPSQGWKPVGRADPVPNILALLATTVGLPYLLLSSTSPLLQSWFVRASRTELPWRLFALSNLGSLVALLAYPVLIEPWLTVREQLVWWSAGYALFAVLCGGVGLMSMRGVATETEKAPRPARSAVLTWLALAAVPSILWLAVGNQLSQDVAAVPFLWILPLAIYLLTFVLCFDHDRWYRPRVFRWLLPLAWAGVIWVSSQRGFIEIRSAVPVLFGALFLCCMFCHGELARLRPETRQLTAFYLTVSAGGAIGGLFVGVFAPRIFTDYYELPVALIGCVVLALWLLYGLSGTRVSRIGAVVAAATVVGILMPSSNSADHVTAIRNFYGVLQVADTDAEDKSYRALFNGTIQHGIQYVSAERSKIPTSYYGPASGAAIALRVLQRRGPMHVGVIGLGVGTLAAYGRKEDRFRFYELNPAVVRIAIDDFKFLKESPADMHVVTGDARLSMERESAQKFDLLAVDAFSGDSIPVHLLTREAFELYFRHLNPRGAIAVHVTNKHLDLAPVVQLAASSFGASASLIHNSSEQKSAVYMSSWVIVTKDPALTKEIGWLSSPIAKRPRVKLWTDDYSNLLFILN